MFIDVPNRLTLESDREALVNLFWKAKRILEIGINEGYTAKLLLDNIPGIQSYVGIDVPSYHVTRLEAQRLEVPVVPGQVVCDDKRVRLFVRPGGSEAVAADEIGECDAAFIDGDHSRIAVEYDSALARQCVRYGVILWHDYRDPPTEVNAVIGRLVNAGAMIDHIPGTWLACERRWR